MEALANNVRSCKDSWCSDLLGLGHKKELRNVSIMIGAFETKVFHGQVTEAEILFNPHVPWRSINWTIEEHGTDFRCATDGPTD